MTGNKGEVLVEMRPVLPDEDLLKNLLLTFGGEIVSVDQQTDVAVLKFGSLKYAESFTLDGHSFTVVAPPENDEGKENIAISNDAPNRLPQNPAIPPVSAPRTPPAAETSVAQIYKERDTSVVTPVPKQTVSSSGARKPLPESDNFYVLAHPDVLAPLCCGALFLYASLATVGLC